MWPKSIKQSVIAISTACAVLLTCAVIAPRIGIAQQLGGSRSGLDLTTQRSLDELQRLLLTGSPDQVKALMQRIINGSGYIKPLAGIVYRLAQNETDAKALANYYFTTIAEWPDSAWAQKAVVELVPLLIMGGGELASQEKEMLIWNACPNLLKPASDAADLGENPEDLQADAFLQLLYLSHFRKNDAQTIALVAQKPKRAEAYQDQIDLAYSYAVGRQGDRAKTRTAVQQWLDRYPNSDYRPLAALALYYASDKQDQMDEALHVVNVYHDSLEAKWLYSNIGR